MLGGFFRSYIKLIAFIIVAGHDINMADGEITLLDKDFFSFFFFFSTTWTSKQQALRDCKRHNKIPHGKEFASLRFGFLVKAPTDDDVNTIQAVHLVLRKNAFSQP